MSTARRVLALATIVLVAAAAGTGYAAWSATGSGSATATGGQPQSVSIAAGASNTQALFPTGAPTGDVTVQISNPNPFRTHVGSLTLDTSQGSAGFSANAASCGLSFATQDGGGAGWDVPANGTLDLDLTGSLTMATSAASSCQGATFTVYLKAVS
jgi:hypothetical protein